MLELLTPPVLLPVPLALAKTFLRVDQDSEDDLITDLIGAAVERIETQLSRALITRTYRLAVPPDLGPLVPIKPVPVAAVTQVKLVDDEDNSALIPPSEYALDLRKEPAQLRLRNGSFATYLASACEVQITFTAGYGDAPADIPLPLRQAILLLTAQSYEHRDQPDHPALPMMADALLMPYRNYRL